MVAKLKAFAAAVVAGLGGWLPRVFDDAFGFFGLALISYGAWLIYRPAGFISAGIFAVAITTLRSVNASPDARETAPIDRLSIRLDALSKSIEEAHRQFGWQLRETDASLQNISARLNEQNGDKAAK